ncbi:MAG: M56 family metallopeptidase, partial [Bryobacteraceae bacterium]
MNALEQLAATYVLNASWQFPLIYLVCLGVLHIWRDMPARLQHWACLACALLAAVLPVTAVLGLFTDGRAEPVEAMPVTIPVYILRTILAAFSVLCVCRAWQLVRAGLQTRDLRRRATPAISIDPTASPILQQAREQGVEILVSPANIECFGPLLAGVRGRVILIPRMLTDAANAHLLEAAIAHELAHVRRKDMLLFLVSELMMIPLSFHPVAERLRRRLAESRELACDERVLGDGMDRFKYARCLL